MVCVLSTLTYFVIFYTGILWHVLEKQGSSTSAQLQPLPPAIQSPEAREPCEDTVFGSSFA